MSPFRFAFVALLLPLALAGAEPLPVGVSVPVFRAPSYDQDRNAVDLGGGLGKGTTLVFFFSKTGRAADTAEALALRDFYTDLQARGIAVIGIGIDGPAELNAFRSEQQLPFLLISDPQRDVAGLFGVDTAKEGGDARQSFLIRDGAIVWRGLDVKPKDQVKAVLAYVAAAVGR